MLGFEHGGNLLEISAVSLFLKVWQEEDGDDLLRDVGEIKVEVALHHILHHFFLTFTPGRIHIFKSSPEEQLINMC